jgi:GDP-L-fucose synthase
MTCSRWTTRWSIRARPDVIIFAAAKGRGILANDTYPADVFHDNLAIETHIIHSALSRRRGSTSVSRPSCIYPKLAPQPIKEEALLTGLLEPLTNGTRSPAGFDISIRELAETVQEAAGFTGRVVFNTSMPDGTSPKLMDSSRLPAIGWKPEISLEDGMKSNDTWLLERWPRI